MSGGGNIKVVVRCRPLNSRELARGATCLVRMDGNQTILSKPGNPNDQKAFTFDKSYWSANKNDPDYADQETVYNDLGRELLDHAFHGYNCCIFAYGQTGSGKSYSMMGYEDKGIIPRTCMELFTRIGNETTEERTFQVEVSYIEIYNEKVRDLLNPRNKGNLKVREHPSLGPYVEDLSRLVVNSYEDIDHLMSEGNKARTVAATNMNESSSRSHAVFTIFLTQKHTDKTAKLSSEKVARISLVDLAGSERANSTGATGTRLKEGANINKSLTTLGKVIASLAEQSNDSGKRSSKKSKEAFIPYRDSVLTWLLKDSLGGNSKTAMLAAISPADYDETLSTLRYADQAKKIRNKPVVNEDPNAKLIRELKQELEALRETLKVYAPEEVGKLLSSENKAGRIDAIKAAAAAATATSASQQQKEPQRITFQGLNGEVKELTKEEVVDQLQSSEKLLNELNETWEEKLSKTEKIHKEREQALEELGIMVEKGNVGVYTPKKAPHLVNLKEDPLMSECLVYKINPGETRVGRLETPDAHIRLSGPNILDQHCVFQNNDGVVTLYPNEGALTMVNGMRILQPKELHSGFRIIIGDYHVFRFNHPEEVRKERDLQRTASVRSSTSSRRDQPLDDQSRPESPAIAIDQESVPTEVIDWNFARREAVLNHYSNEFNFGGLSDEDLEKVFDDISKLRLLRKRTSDIRTDADDESISRTSMSSYRMGTVSTAPTTAEDVTDTLSIDTGHLTTDTEELLRLAREEMQQRLELQKQEYEERLRLVEQANVQSQDLEEEKRSMEEKLQHVKAEMQKLLDDQKKAYESKIKRISLHIPPGICPQSPLYSPVGAGSQMDLARKVIGKWRSLRYVSMAEAILSNAIVIKEANVISKELGKNVVYQFTVVHDDTSANAVSFWESASALQPFGRQADKSLLAETKPCIAVMVTDKQHQVNYIWSLDKIKQRLQLMRSLYDFSEKPQPQRQYFNREDPFYENPCPRFTLIGLARLTIRNLAFQVPIESVVDVICRNTGRVMGQVKVLVAPIARSVARQFPINDNSKHLACLLHIGQQLVFEVRILELIGVTENNFTLVHAQFHLAALRVDSADRVYTTDPISNFGNSVVRFNHSQTISLTVTAGILQNILHGSLVIEVFGRAQPEFLYDKLDWDAEREQEMNTPSTRRLSALSTLQESQEEEEDELAPVNRLLQRRRKSVIDRTDPAEGLLFEERHDIIAWIQILELTPQGDYAPVAVVSQDASDPGCLSLRQGLQRRIKLELIHDSGRQFMWQNISNVTIGNARLVDANGKTIDAGNESHCADVSVQLFPEQTSEYDKNGTAVLCAQGSWDSSLHGSRILNKTTPANQRVLVTLSWQVQCDRCVAPLQFKMDAAIKIYSRDSTTKDNPGMLRSFLGGSTQRKTRKLRSIFVAHLKPPVTRHAKDLWRLNTATKYVRGEEFLGPWKPRSVSLVNDYREARRKMLLREAVSATKHNLVLWERQRSRANRNSRVLELDNTKPISGIIDKDALLRKVMDLWTSQPDKLPDMVISQEPPEELSSPDTPRPEDELEGAAKLNAQVYSVIPSVTTTKRGFLMQPKNGGEEWIKRWFVLKRPYILVYEDQSEAEELGMMNLNNVRVDYKKDLEGLLQRPNVFAVYTCNNAYLLQALDHADMIDWISKIDQFYPVDKLDPQCL